MAAETRSVAFTGTWVKEGDELLYMIKGEYAAISMLFPDDDNDDYQLTIGYPSNIKEQHFLFGDIREVKKNAGAIADKYLDEHETPTLTN